VDGALESSHCERAGRVAEGRKRRRRHKRLQSIRFTTMSVLGAVGSAIRQPSTSHVDLHTDCVRRQLASSPAIIRRRRRRRYVCGRSMIYASECALIHNRRARPPTLRAA